MPVLALAEQYLAFVEAARKLRLELAADYLVMAAWLAYLKSALLLPREEQEDPSPEELALRLQLRLQRLGAMRDAAARMDTAALKELGAERSSLIRELLAGDVEDGDDSPVRWPARLRSALSTVGFAAGMSARN